MPTFTGYRNDHHLMSTGIRKARRTVGLFTSVYLAYIVFFESDLFFLCAPAINLSLFDLCMYVLIFIAVYRFVSSMLVSIFLNIYIAILGLKYFDFNGGRIYRNFQQTKNTGFQ